MGSSKSTGGCCGASGTCVNRSLSAATCSPRVSIGVPVYNGAKYLPATLDSILTQTYRDFEIVVSDNGSTDATPRICEEYAKRDSRVRVFRFPQNVGPAANYNKTFELARGEYFKWQAADDVIAPTFLEKLVPILENDPTVVDAYPRTGRIDADGNAMQPHTFELDLTDPSPARRFARYILADHRKHHAAELWGVIRASALRNWAPELKGAYPSGDRVYIARVALCGKMKRVEEYLHFDRTHPNRSELSSDRSKIRNGSRLARYIGVGPLPPYQWWDSSKAGKIVFPEWKWLWEYYRSVFLVPLTIRQRAACLGVMLALSVKFVPRLTRDVLIAIEQVLMSPARGSEAGPSGTGAVRAAASTRP